MENLSRVFQKQRKKHEEIEFHRFQDWVWVLLLFTSCRKVPGKIPTYAIF